MTSPTAENPVDAALETLTERVAAWDPDQGADVEPMLDALRELLMSFDPRKDRVSSSLCTVSMTLLEELRSAGAVASSAAIGAVGELARGLRESLAKDANPVGGRGGAYGDEVVLSAPKSTPTISMALDDVDQPIGQVMLRMGMITEEQVDHVLQVQADSDEESRKLFGEIAIELGYVADSLVESVLRLQARGRGETPAPKTDSDPWGNSPL